MSLPSKYAPEGLSRTDQHRTITLGKKVSNAVNYTVKLLEDRINTAVNNVDNVIGDIEMIPMDDDQEVEVISAFVRNSRDSSDLVYQQDPIEDNMEIEISSPIEGRISFLVLDTNFILSHLDIVDGLSKLATKFGLKIIIPITVMKELDGLKKSTRIVSEEQSRGLSQISMGHLARWANDWIYRALAESNHNVKGQKLGQRLDKNTTKDDAILDCCLYLQEYNPTALVVLLSNDKNFCLKALANEILTVSFRKSMTADLISNVIYEENVSKISGLPHIYQENIYTKNAPIEHPQTGHLPMLRSEYLTQTLLQNNTPKQYTPTPQGANSNTRQIIYDEIQQVTLAIIDHCMFSEYGDDLESIRDYHKDSTVSLKDCSKVLMRFWKVVFHSSFRGSSIQLEDLGTKRYQNFVEVPKDADELQKFVTFWSNILELLYESQMDDIQNKALQALILRWKKMSV